MTAPLPAVPSPLPPAIIPSETPVEHVGNVLALLTLARHGQMVTGAPARLLTLDEFGAIMRRLYRVAEQLKAAEQHQCSLPESIVQALNSGDGVYRP
jgi:hypothetical protein